MKTVLRMTGKLLLGLLGLLVLVIIVLKLITDNQYREWINGAVSNATGREFSIDSLELDFGTTLRAKAEGVSLANATWSELPEALAARSLEAEIRLPALFKGLADITVVGDGLEVSVESGPDGESNWQLGTTQQPEPVTEETDGSGGLPIRPFIRRLAVLDSEVTTAIGPPTLPRKLTIREFSVTTPQTDTLVQLDAALDDYPLSMDGNLGPLDQVLDRVSAPLTLEASLADISLAINGQWGPLVPAPDLAAQVNLAAPSISDILAMVGIQMADPGALDISAILLSDGGQLALQSVETSVGGELVDLSATGGITNVNALEGIDFNVLMDTDTLHRLVTHFGVELPGELPALATVQAHVHGGIDVLSVSDIEIRVGDEGLSAEVTGGIKDAVGLKGVSAQFSADVASTGALSKFAGMAIPAVGSLSLKGQLNDSDGPIALRDFTAGLLNEDNTIGLTGQIGNLMQVESVDAEIAIDIKQFSADTVAEISRVLADNGIDFSAEQLPDSLALNAKVSGGMKALAVNDLQASVSDSELELALNGAVDNVMDLSGAQGTLTLKGPITEVLRQQTGLSLPESGNLDLQAQVEYLESVARLTDLDGGLTGGIAEISLDGSIADLATISGVDIAISMALDTLTEEELGKVEALLTELDVSGVPLELLPASISLGARLTGDLEQLSLEDVKGTVEDEGIAIDISGSVDDLQKQGGIEANIALDVDSVATLSRYAQTDLPELGALDIDARIFANEGAYSLEQLQAELDGQGLNITVEGSVADLIALKGIQLNLDGGVDSLSVLSDAVAKELPDTPPVELIASLGEATDGGAILNATVSTGETSLRVESSLSDLMSPADLVVNIQASAKTLSDLQDFVDREIPDVGPFSLEALVSANQTTGAVSYTHLTLPTKIV